MYTQDDTIAAIVTASGEAGVSIVRISGPQAFFIADTVFKCKPPCPSKRPAHTFVYGHVMNDDQVIDEAVLLVMKSPQSFTKEDVVEIQCHGGNMCSKLILRYVLESGARLAEPGEFTKRAFLNGRIDLLQAEAVLDIIHAKSERASAAALEQLEGNLSAEFDILYEDLLRVSADIEATLDFTEQDLPKGTMKNLNKRLLPIREKLDQLISTWEEGHLLRDGAIIVISGKPNVGKSTLLNTLLGRQRAIVSSMPGTTRDTIEENLVIGGIPLRLVDTAGLRDSSCEIEKEGIDRTRAYIQKADMHIYMIDASKPIDHEVETHLKKMENKESLVVINKMDLCNRLNTNKLRNKLSVQMSLKECQGLDKLKSCILERLGKGGTLSSRPHGVISERHRNLLMESKKELDEAINMMNKEREDLTAFVSSRLRSSIENIGLVTGKEYEDELLENIFSRFCIGK